MSRTALRQLITAVCLVTTLLCSSADNSTAFAQDATPTHSNVPLTLTVTGRVTSGTGGITIPAALPIVLQIAHQDQSTGETVEAFKQQVPLNADNTFTFENVIGYAGDIAIVSTTFEGIQQVSAPIQLENGQTQLTLPLTLYGITNDVSTVSLLRVQHILDFIPGAMQVLATYDFRNNSDKVYISTERTKTNLPISVSVPLPVGAQAIAFNLQSTQRFFIGGNLNAPVVQDSKPLIPGQVEQVVFSYQLPYASGTPIDQDYLYGATIVEVLIPDDKNVKLSKPRINSAELTADDFTVSPNTAINAARPYTQYTIKKALKPGDRLIYMLESGNTVAAIPTRNATTSPTSSTGFPVGFLAIGALLVLVVGIGVLVARAATQRSA